MYTPKGEINDALYELMKNKEVVDKMANAASAKECYEVVTAAGLEISEEEFKTSMGIMKDYLEESQDGILSEEDLDQVAGGKSGDSDLAKSIIDLGGKIIEAFTAAS